MMFQQKKYAMLSFDLEEFDVPCEYGVNMTLQEQVAISVDGVYKILDILKKYV